MNDNTPAEARGTCPICGKPPQAKYRPFCSKRCADVDLQRWFSGRYAIPAVESEEGSSEAPEDADER